MDAGVALMLSLQAAIMGVIYASLALGFNMVYRVSKSINLAHPEIALFAAYVAYIASVRTGIGLVPAILLAATAGFAIGAAMERLVARPLLGRPPVALIAATLGVFYVLRGASIAVAGPDWSGGSYELPATVYRLGPVALDFSDIVAVTAAGGIVALVVAMHRFTKLGVAMRAVAEDAYGAAAYGLPVKRLTMLSWGLAGASGALAGVALAAKAGVSPGLDAYVLKALAASLLAGLDSVAGIVLGGVILGFVEQFSDYLLGPILPGFGNVAAFLVMLVVLLVKPYGLFGTERIERV